MLLKLGAPPLLLLVIVLGLLAFVIYRIASAGQVQPLSAVFLVLLGFGLVRVLLRLWRASHDSESD